jgi:hypothetical protein
MMEAMYFAKRNVIFNDLQTDTLTTPTPNKSIQSNINPSKSNNQSPLRTAAVLSSKTKTSQLLQNHLAKQNNQSIKTDSIFKQNLNENQMKSTSFNAYNPNNSNNKRFLNRPVTPSTLYNKITRSSKENINKSTETINIINKNNNKKPLNTNNQIITHLLNNSLINDNTPSYMAFNNKSEVSFIHDFSQQNNNQNSINHFNHTPPKIKTDELNSKNMQNTFIQINRLTENHIKLKEQILNHYLSNTSTTNPNKHNDDLINSNFKNNSINNPANFESRSTLMDYHSKLRLVNNNSNNSSYTKFISNSMNKLKMSNNITSKKLSPSLKMNNKEYSFNLKSMHNNSANQSNQFYNQFINKTSNSENQFRRSSLETSLDEKNRLSTVNSKLNNQINEKQFISVDLVRNLNKNGEINSNLVNNKSESRASNNNALVINYLSNKLINNRTSPKTHLQSTTNNLNNNTILASHPNQQTIDNSKENKIQESIIQTKEFINNNEDKEEFDINQISNNKNLEMTLDKESLLLLEQINKKCNEWLDKHVIPFIYINTSSSVSIDSSSSFEDESNVFK